MFTGIVEEMGTVVSMSEQPDLTLWDGSVGKGFVLVVECSVCLIDSPMPPLTMGFPATTTVALKHPILPTVSIGPR